MLILYYFWTLLHIIYKPFHKHFNEFLLKYNIAYIVYSNKIISKILDYFTGLFLNTYYYLDFDNTKSQFSRILFLIKLRSNNIHCILKLREIIKLKTLIKIYKFFFIDTKIVCFNDFNDFIKEVFFFKKYIYNYLNFIFFFDKNKNNIIKILYIYFMSRFSIKSIKGYNNIFTYAIIGKPSHSSKNSAKTFDLIRFYDWYKYTFTFKYVRFSEIRKNEIRKNTPNYMKLYRKFRENRMKYLYKLYSLYDKNLNAFKNFGILYKNIFIVQLKDLYIFKFLFLLDKQKLVNKYPIRFSESSINKYIQYSDIKNFNFFFLRKNRIFNKSRYSRNRQLYRTGVYWCLWLNIIIVYGLFFLFYRFTFNFGYMWFGIMLLLYSFIFSKVIKYNFINIFSIFKEFYLLLQWYGHILYNILLLFRTWTHKRFINIDKLFFIYNWIDSNAFVFFNKLYIEKILNIWNKLEYAHLKIFWLTFKQFHGRDDNSFLKHETIIFYYKQFINNMLNND